MARESSGGEVERSESAKVPYPLLVRSYVAHVKPHTRGKAAQWGEAWIEGTQVFGRQLVWAGAAVVCASWLHTELGWRMLLGSMGLVTLLVGAWHRVHARSICTLALSMSSAPGDTEEKAKP
jgi:hypothetical protein